MTGVAIELPDGVHARDVFVEEMFDEMGSLATARPTPFPDYVMKVNPTLMNYEHVPRLVDVGERIITGELENVLVLLPPRYFKTEIFSRLLAPCFMERRPGQLVGLSSYGADLAWSISEEARDNYVKAGGRLYYGTTAKKRWRTIQGGMMWAAGVGGPHLGFGYHLGIIDDPQDPERAESYIGQRKFIVWYPKKFVSRGEPGAQKLVVMQRLGNADAIDFLFRREVGLDTDLAPEHWHVVVCDEIKSNERLADFDGPMGLPPTCTIEPDPRPVGAILSPSRMSQEQVESRQRSSGPYTTATQRQQRPMAPVGEFWREEWFGTYDDLPADAYNLGWDWDLAYTRKEVNSASAGVRSARGPGGGEEFTIYIEDIAFDWLEFPELIAFIKERPGPHYIEAKASGKSAKQALNREGISAAEVKVSKDKMARAAGIQPVVSNKRVLVRRSIITALMKGSKQGLLNVRAENLAADKGDLDLNDAFVQGVTRHVSVAPELRFVFSPDLELARQDAEEREQELAGIGAD